MTHNIKRIGIMTGGGDCPGLNAVIRAVTKSAINDHGLDVFGIEDGFLGLIENRIHPLTENEVGNILTLGGTILGTTNKAAPRHYPIGEDEAGNVVYGDVSDRIVKHLQHHGIDLLVAIGGDGTMSSAAPFIEHGIKVIGIPKTIDNDIMHSDMTFGFQTAVQTATEAVDRVQSTAASHHRVMIVETMGRNAGWLALHTGIAGGADVILLPEIPYDIDVVANVCIERRKQGKRSTIIVVSEGARPKDGGQVVREIIKDSMDPIRLGGISSALTEQIANRTGLETRYTILGHIQRGGTPCAYDRVLATKFGHYATDLIERGEFNRMITVRADQLTSVDIQSVADQQRTIPLDSPDIAAARAVSTCFGD